MRESLVPLTIVLTLAMAGCDAVSPAAETSSQADSITPDDDTDELSCGGWNFSGPCGTDTVTPRLEPLPEGRGFQIDQGTFSLDSGVEGTWCMRFPIPSHYADGPVYVRGVESRLPAGTHHYFMAYSPVSVDKAEPCHGDSALTLANDDKEVEASGHTTDEGKAVFISGVGDFSYELPDGYALFLESGLGHFNTSHHALNLTKSTAHMYGLFNIMTAPKEEVTYPVNVVNCLLQDILVPAHTTQDMTATCTVPFDLDLVILGSHAHHHLTRFEMRRWDGKATVGEAFYESTQWDAPKIVALQEPMSLLKGEGITFTCTFRNDADVDVIFGGGEHGEMCAIMSAYAYPKDRPGEVPPTLGTIIPKAGDWMPLFDTSQIEGPF